MLSEQYFSLLLSTGSLGWVWMQFEWYFRESTEVGKYASTIDAEILIIFTPVSLGIWVKLLLHTAGWQDMNLWISYMKNVWLSFSIASVS